MLRKTVYVVRKTKNWYVKVVLLSLRELYPRTLYNFSETVPTEAVVLAYGFHLLVRSREDLVLLRLKWHHSLYCFLNKEIDTLKVPGAILKRFSHRFDQDLVVFKPNLMSSILF